MRGTRGLSASRPASKQPIEPLELFEFEACPYCRKVREVLSELDLEYIARTAARGSSKRDEVVRRGGKAQFPFLVDPNTGVSMYESEDIITYLHETYRNGRSRMGRLVAPANTAFAALASLVRRRGIRVRDSVPERDGGLMLLELYNFEASPYCRKARETLSELDLDYVVHNVAKKSARRPELVARGGKMMVPYLIDPNTGTEMYESDDIVAYLHRTYSREAPAT